MKPLFIFSLPRSGSTLLQKLIASTGQVSTTAEPWVLLPHLYARKSSGVSSEYWHDYAVSAIGDFCSGFPNGMDDYDEELRAFIMGLYQKAAEDGACYFLDKTPRYHLLCKEIIDLFPDGKFIFLWRNPLAIVSSLLNSWCNGRWKIDLYNVDIYDGLNNLIDVYERYSRDVHSLRYEDLVASPENEMRKLCSYLDIKFDKEKLHSFREIDFGSGMGDKVGARKYREINPSSIDSWWKDFATPLRRRWALKYLRQIGEERLGAIGYDCCELKKGIMAQRGLSLQVMLVDLLLSCRERSKNIISCNSLKKNSNRRNW